MTGDGQVRVTDWQPCKWATPESAQSRPSPSTEQPALGRHLVLPGMGWWLQIYSHQLASDYAFQTFSNKCGTSALAYIAHPGKFLRYSPRDVWNRAATCRPWL